ncbi:MAG: hypothetical protein WD872_01385 [Pirellulaceae bacterium]
MSVTRDPMRDSEPPGSSGMSLAGIVLVPLGLILICIGLCLGLWLVSIAYSLLYHPDQVPLVSQVLDLIEKDDTIFQVVQEDKTTRIEGAGVRYGLLLLVLLLVVFFAIGSVIRAFLAGGRIAIEAGLGRKPDEPRKK